MTAKPKPIPDAASLLSANRDPATSDARVAWLFNCIGTPTSLLYWNGILPPYLLLYPQSWFFTARPPSQQIPGTNKSVKCIGSVQIPLGRRRESYDRQIVFGSPRIISALREIRPDVVVIQEMLSFAIYLAMFRKRLPGAKLLLLLESDPIRGIPWRKKRWVWALRKFVAKRMDLFLTNNAAGQRYLTRELGVPENRILVRPYLVSEIKPAAEAHGPSELPAAAQVDVGTRIVFLYVGQLTERKGIEQLLRAIALVEPHVRQRARFWLVGDGDQRDRLEVLAEELAIGDQVRFLGQQSYQRLVTFYSAADAFVMPTLDDYRALVGFEALSHGLPLLHSVYDGAVTELVEEGKNGTRCDPRDTSQFAQRITWMIEHADQFPEMGQFSQRRAAAGYTVEHAVESLGAAIQQCLES